jgi:hypothetical protein
MQKKSGVLNSIDVVRSFVEEMEVGGMPRYQMLGGVGSAALLNTDTTIDTDARVIHAPKNLYLSNFRRDGNRRDVEVLAMSSRSVDAMGIEDCLERTIGDKLIPEVFDIRDEASLAQLTARPLGLRAMSMFLSDRYLPGQMEYSGEGTQLQRILVPFAVSMAHAALETWTLEIGNDLKIPVPSPGATVVNYLTRSISGLRAKDAEKVQIMSEAIFTKAPETVDWIIDGPGSSQFEMARILHTLRESQQHPRRLVVGGRLMIDPLLDTRFEEHPAFMFSNLDLEAQRKIIRLAKIKSRGLHSAESYRIMVTLFQRYIEPAINSITHNK